MSRYRGPRLRLVRRLGELPGLISPKMSHQLHSGGAGKGKRKLEDEKKPNQADRGAQQKESQWVLGFRV